MPVNLTPVGSTCDVAIIDSNFATWQDLFRSGVQVADISGTFDRYRVRRYTSGNIVSAHSFANSHRNRETDQSLGIIEQFDLPFRQGTEDAGNYTAVQPRAVGEHRNAYEMELLGKPGPSFYYSFQEDGYNPAVLFVGVAGWPPTNWPPGRYPDDLCFSRWLTVPGASLRIYVPYPCVARVRGALKGSFLSWARLQTAAATSDDPNNELIATGNVVLRLGLVVDTNPVLYTDEFVNTNPNILNPVTGATASYCSWKVIRDLSFSTTSRSQHEEWAEVALKGGRYYNFSLKYRDACTHGFIRDNGGAPVWDDGIWEWHGNGPDANHPNATHLYYALSPFASLYDSPYHPLWTNLIESGSLDVEFFYGRGNAYVTDTASADFNAKV